MATAREIITQSLRLLQRLGATASAPDANDEEVCRVALNDWIDGQNTHPLMLFAEARNTHNLVGDQATYTIGTGGDFNQTRPVTIEGVGIILDPSATDPQEISLGLPMTLLEFRRVPVKSLTSAYPARWYYDHAYASGLGSITFVPVPDSSTPDAVIYTKQPLTEITVANLNTTLYLPQGYRRMLTYNLAVEAAPLFDVAVPPDVAAIAVQALSDVRQSNWRPTTLQYPAGLFHGRGARFDINTGE